MRHWITTSFASILTAGSVYAGTMDPLCIQGEYAQICSAYTARIKEAPGLDDRIRLNEDIITKTRDYAARGQVHAQKFEKEFMTRLGIDLEQRSRVYLQQGNKDAALNDLRRALTLLPEQEIPNLPTTGIGAWLRISVIEDIRRLEGGWQ